MPHRRPSPSPFLSPPVLIILLPIVTILLLLYTIPPFLSFISQILRPTISVKKSWDSLNVFLVIFAILCGIFAKRNEDNESPAEEDRVTNTISDPLSHTNDTASTSESDLVRPQQWFGSSDRINTAAASGGGGLRRTSSSYPDLRQAESIWGDHQKSQFRFFDDFEINGYNRPPPKSHHPHQSRAEEYSDVIKEIPVDTFVAHSSPPPISMAPPPPPSPPPRQQTRRTYQTTKRKGQKKENVVINNVTHEAEELGKAKSPPPTPPPAAAAAVQKTKTYQTVGRKDQKKEKISSDNIINEAEELEKVRSPPPTPPPRPAAPPSPLRIRSEQRRRKSNVKREIAMVWASVLSNQKKKKKQPKAAVSRDIYENAAQSSPEQPQQGQETGHFSTRRPPSPPPPPPPPPPPYSVFHNLFKKGTSKTKKVHSVSPPPPDPPPPPPPQPALRKHKSWSTIFPSTPPTPPPQRPPRASWRRDSTGSGRPPLPTKTNSYLDEENVNSGCQSPLIPPPPPLPPFKLPELRFSVKGDFVKLQSPHSSRCASPELEDEELESKSNSESQSSVNVIGGGSSAFCPSPDVNMKAANFIARLRDEWRLEKVNSMKERNKMA